MNFQKPQSKNFSEIFKRKFKKNYETILYENKLPPTHLFYSQYQKMQNFQGQFFLTKWEFLHTPIHIPEHIQ